MLQVPIEEYHLKGTSQFEEMKLIPDSSEINLWFEDDLFCQCNMWFVINLLLSVSLSANIYLVRPTSESWMGFGAMNESQFAQAYKNRIPLSKQQLFNFQKLWKIYNGELIEDPIVIGKELSSLIPRMEQVIKAHLDRLPPNNRPMSSLKKILAESKDKSFPPVFKKFSIREGIYGFGDTSIKKMYDHLIKK